MRRLVTLLFAFPLALGCASNAPKPEEAASPTAKTAPAAAASPVQPEAAKRPALPPLPDTPRIPVVDTYFGTRVEDPYRWLEVRGDVVEATEEGAVEHIDKLSWRYDKVGYYTGAEAELRKTQARVIYKIRPTHVIAQG